MKTRSQSVPLIACLILSTGCAPPQRPAPTPTAAEMASPLPSPVEPTAIARATTPTPLTFTPTMLPQLTQPAPTSQPERQPTSAPSTDALPVNTVEPTPCPQRWQIEGIASSNCPSVTTVSEAAAQRFERGIMVWLKDPGVYLIALDTKVLPEWRQTWVNDPLTIYRDTSASYTPPAGLYAPQSGFGLVWRGDVFEDGRGYQDLIGWALAPEVGFEGVLQTAYFSVDRYERYASTPFGLSLWYSQPIAAWFVNR